MSFHPSARSLRSRSIPLATAIVLSASFYVGYQRLRPLALDSASLPSRPTLPDSPQGSEVLPNSGAAGSSKRSRAPLPSTGSPYTPLGWGSNRYLVLAADTNLGVIKRPTALGRFGSTPLRHLVLAEKYGACVDAKGDCWMWGVGYDASGEVGRSLKGKSIRQLAPGPAKLFALSRSGKLYAVPAPHSFQHHRLDRSEQSWLSWLFSSDAGVDHIELKAEGGLKSGERWTDVSVGSHHLLAVTSKGRTFSLPLSPAGNSHRQLGTRQVFDTPYPVASSKAAAQPLSPSLPPEADIRFCRKLTEIPSLTGLRVEQVATSDRTSFVRTPAGQVLGWGANESGQIGLGANAVVETVSVPVEVVLAKNYPGGTSIRCLDVTAGGGVTFYTVEKEQGGRAATVDLLAAGNGMTGALGNGLWSSASGSPVRVKTVSGLQEYSEKDKAFIPLGIHQIAVSASPSAHVFAVLDTVSEAPIDGVKKGIYGKDVMVWGGNADYQLGNGKRSSLAVPQHLPPLISRPIDPIMDGRGNADTVGSGTLSPMPHSRLQLHVTKTNAYDLLGKLLKRGVVCEETMAAGWGCSMLYNKIID